MGKMKEMHEAIIELLASLQDYSSNERKFILEHAIIYDEKG